MMTVAQTRFGPHNTERPREGAHWLTVLEAPLGEAYELPIPGRTEVRTKSPEDAIGGVVPAMAHAYALATELAKPVARGYLTRSAALAEMLTSTLAKARRNEINGLEPTDVFRLQRHLFFQHLNRLETRRAITESRIKNRIWPLMKERKPRNVVLAEAHGVNGAAGFPFDEPDVTTITTREMHYAGRQRHG